MFTFSFLLYPLIVLGFFGITSRSEQRSRLGALKTVVNYKLFGHAIRILKGGYLTQLSCAQSCLANMRCESTNFGVTEHNELVCELNDYGVPVLADQVLIYAKGFTFSSYSKVNFAPSFVRNIEVSHLQQ